MPRDGEIPADQPLPGRPVGQGRDLARLALGELWRLYAFVAGLNDHSAALPRPDPATMAATVAEELRTARHNREAVARLLATGGALAEAAERANSVLDAVASDAAPGADARDAVRALLSYAERFRHAAAGVGGPAMAWWSGRRRVVPKPRPPL